MSVKVVERCPKWYWKISLSEADHKQVPAPSSSWVTCKTLTGWDNFADNGLVLVAIEERVGSGGNSGAAVRSDQARIRQSWPAAKRMSWSWSIAMPYIIFLSSDLLGKQHQHLWTNKIIGVRVYVAPKEPHWWWWWSNWREAKVKRDKLWILLNFLKKRYN